MLHRDLVATRDQPLLRCLHPRLLRALLQDAFLRDHSARAELVREGAPAPFLHMIAEGRVEMFATHRGRATTLDVLDAGQCFTLAAVVLNVPSMQSARSLTAARLLHIPADAVRAALARDVTFARRLAEALALAYRGVASDLKGQRLRSSVERLADWLISYDAATGGTRRLVVPNGKRVLAALLGMAPEVLSRAFAALIPYHVRVQGPLVQIGDLGALQKLAETWPPAGGAFARHEPDGPSARAGRTGLLHNGLCRPSG